MQSFFRWTGRNRAPEGLSPAEQPVVKAEQTGPAGHIGSRRKDCFWEPIYNPNFILESEPYYWDLQRDAGPSHRFVLGDKLKELATKGESVKVVNKTFQSCDLQGHFGNDFFINFINCKFIDCDFAFSFWKHANFRKCTFQGSSLSLASFDDCEFRDCTWINIGIASKTEFRRTFLNNPASLIAATVSQPDPAQPTSEHHWFQRYRLRVSRAHVLRNILISHQSVGDEHTFYETVREHEICRTNARLWEDWYELRFKPGKRIKAAFALLFHFLDHSLLRAFGWLNGWGASAIKPFSALLACLAGFGLLYRYGNFDTDIASPWQKSFDLTFLVGYGNQVVLNDANLTLVQNVQVTLAIVIYTVFFATVVSKLSRAR